MAKKRNIQGILWSWLHAAVMVLFTWVWLNFGPTSEDERLLIRASTIAKRLLFNIAPDRPQRHELMFINVAHDLDLIPRLDGNGKKLITNRAALARVLEFFKQHPDYYRYIVCDIVFDQADESENGRLKDSLLRAAFANLPRVVCAAGTNSKGALNQGLFPGKKAAVEYRARQGSLFLKFKLYQGKNKSLPLVMYEDIHQGKMASQGLGYTLNGRPSFNKMIIDFRVRQHHLRDTSFYGGYYTLQTMGELIDVYEFDADIFDFMKKHRPIVMIGDFTRADVHRTVVGQTAGTLILLNVYLGLVKGQSIISPFLVLLIWLGYFVLSYLTFYGLPFKTSNTWRRFSQTFFGKLIIEYISIALFLMLLTVLTYALFHVHLNILIMGVYIRLLYWVLSWRRRRKEQRHSPKQEQRQEGPRPSEFDQKDISMYKPGKHKAWKKRSFIRG
ncbi:CHASE2 domain-containing protein [Microscilla marina]|uniref:CHASE2 domain-containing protein n=1 Tax=Microscilla marina ATCC 23134 TaxID=313606 RepID=A1ZUN4_MICM2|nr:hypothetical protein [Microscilla marina]EAY25920.1 hypothetical protein M23134_00874 [Microscilla marina ATCC 23134]